MPSDSAAEVDQPTSTKKVDRTGVYWKQYSEGLGERQSIFLRAGAHFPVLIALVAGWIFYLRKALNSEACGSRLVGVTALLVLAAGALVWGAYKLWKCWTGYTYKRLTEPGELESWYARQRKHHAHQDEPEKVEERFLDGIRSQLVQNTSHNRRVNNERAADILESMYGLLAAAILLAVCVVTFV